MASLTEEQTKIMEALPNINMIIEASPGSGKTTMIMYRVYYLWKAYGVPLSSIAIFTYSKFLASDMISKLPHFGMDKNDLGWCGTIHAFCYRDTKNMSDLTPWIQMYKETGYEKTLLKYIIFDEYQDAEASIADVIKILSKNRYLTLTGDERQQIYGYKGADASLLLQAKPDFVKFSLSRSFRCNKNICALISRFYPSYPQITSEIDGPKPILYRNRGKSMSNPKIIDHIVNIVKRGIKNKHSIAILTPILESEKTLLFMNDIQSNLMRHCSSSFNLVRANDESYTTQTQHVITTIHKAKGREFDVVIMLNVVDGSNFFDAPNAPDLSKLFVGCSRARHELHIFEYLFSDYVGTLKWIGDNEDLMDYGPYPFNLKTQKPRSNNKSEDNHYTKNCTDFVRSLSSDQRKDILSNYSDPQVVSTELGIGSPFCDVLLFGVLIEWALAIKFTQKLPVIAYKIYLTSNEWLYAIKQKIISSTLKKKIGLVVGDGFIASIKSNCIKVKVGINNVALITEDNIVSSIMCEEYYKHLPTAISKLESLTPQLTPDNISKLWWLVRFECLTRLSLVKFEQPELDPVSITRLIEFIATTKLLSPFTPLYHHVCGTKDFDNIEVQGETDFISSKGIIEVKCFSSDSNMEDAWLQVIIYNEMQLIDNPFDSLSNKFSSLSLKSNKKKLPVQPNKNFNYDTVYIYNPVRGKLLSRRRL